MTPTPTQRALRKSVAQIRHVSAVTPSAANDLVAAVYQQAEQDFGMLAPPVALHSAAPGPLAACWLMLRETLVAQGRAHRAAKETVAATVSMANACPYCVTVHNAVLGGLSHQRTAAAIASDEIDSITSPDLRELAAWARASGRRETATRRELPFPADQLPELGGVAVTFHYLNRMVTLFLADSPLPAVVPGAIARPMTRVLGSYLTSAVRRAPQPGTSLTLLPPASLPAELSWTTANPAIADAFARAIAAIETASTNAVPEPVRDLVATQLNRWDGDPPGLTRSWADDAVSLLAPAHRATARLALLTAIAPYQAGQADIAQYRRTHPADKELIELTAWASMTAARHIASWLTHQP